MSRAKIDWELVRSLCQILCTEAEIAGVLKVGLSTLSEQCKTEQGIPWSDFFEKNSSNGRASIRRHLFEESAKHVVGATIFLAKNYCGMTDLQEVHQNVKISNAEELSDSELATLISSGKQERRSEGDTKEAASTG